MAVFNGSTDNAAQTNMLGITNAISTASGALSLVALGVALVKPSPGISDITLGPGSLPIGLVLSPVATLALNKGAIFGITPTPDVITQDRLSLKAQITDHYTEKNSALQDHIAFEPTKYTLSGVVCELVYLQTRTERIIRSFIQRLTSLGLLKPSQNSSALTYLDLYDQMQSAILSAAQNAYSIYDLFGLDGTGENNKQKIAYQFLEKMYYSRATMTIDTPWKSFKDMAIESIDVSQDDESRTQSIFDIAFKEMRFTSGPATSTFMSVKQAAQAAKTTEVGKVSGKPALESDLSKMFNQ